MRVIFTSLLLCVFASWRETFSYLTLSLLLAKILSPHGKVQSRQGKARVLVFTPIALLLTLASCSLLPSRPPAPALHDFGPAEKAIASENGAWFSVTVDAPEWLQSENIRYRLLYSEPTRVRFYSQDRWLAPTPALLAQRLSLSQGINGLRLKIRLLEFEQVFDSPQNARLILAFRATAMAADSEKVIGEKIFQFNRATVAANAQGAVAGSAQIIGEAVSGLHEWLVGINQYR